MIGPLQWERNKFALYFVDFQQFAFQILSWMCFADKVYVICFVLLYVFIWVKHLLSYL